MSGSVPFIMSYGNFRFDRNSGNIQSVLYDDGETGIGTNTKYSAHNLVSSTLQMKLKLSAPGNRKFMRSNQS
jgi:hypothetical protein